MAVGSDFLGAAVSAAARPTSSVPANAKAASVKTLHMPLKPLWKAPGSFQYSPPMYPRSGVPPQLRTMPSSLAIGRVSCERYTKVRHSIGAAVQTHMKPIMAMTLIMEKTYSASPYPLTPNMLIVMMVARKMVTKRARGRDLSQYSIVRDAAMTSSGRTASHCNA